MAQINPGYLVTLQEQGAYVGGMMITDHRGIPIDFKYTDPVLPTKVQRIIYGSVLEQYIRNHVIIGALCKDMTVQAAFFVTTPHQLHDIQEANALSLISIQRTQFPSLGEKGAVSRSKENECLIQGWSMPNPLRILFGPMAVDKQEAAIKDILFLSKHMDLVEPLERLEVALKSLCLEKVQD